MSVALFRKLIHKRMREMAGLLDANYPPTLSGSNATTLTTEANDMKSDCDDILQESLFSGITPVAASQPIGSELYEWLEDIEQDAYTITGLASPTTAEKQEAADIYFTLSGETANLISSYT